MKHAVSTAAELAAFRATVTVWRFTLHGEFVGRLQAKPDETTEQARARFLKMAPIHKGQPLLVQGGR